MGIWRYRHAHAEKICTLDNFAYGNGRRKTGDLPTMINFMQELVYTTLRLFVASLRLYENLGNTKVNPAEFDLAQPFFVQIGFTKNDIDDFKEFISDPVHHDLTYISAYELYMKEFDLATGGSK